MIKCSLVIKTTSENTTLLSSILHYYDLIDSLIHKPIKTRLGYAILIITINFFLVCHICIFK